MKRALQTVFKSGFFLVFWPGWTDGLGGQTRTNLGSLLSEAQSIGSYIQSIGDVVQADSLKTSQGDADDVMKAVKMLQDFTAGIHYSVSENVDIPFAKELDPILNAAYALNPSDMTITKTGSNGSRYTVSLIATISAMIEDPDLKADFEKRAQTLDKDVISATLLAVMAETLYWESQFQLAAEIKGITNEVFTDEVMADWDKKTEEERAAIINEYLGRIGCAMHGLPYTPENAAMFTFGTNVDNKDDSDGITFGTSNGSHIIQLEPRFITDATPPFDIEKLINTIVHEMRHDYQIGVANGQRSAPEGTRGHWAGSFEYGYNYKKENEGRVMPFDDYWKQAHESDARAFAGLVGVN